MSTTTHHHIGPRMNLGMEYNGAIYLAGQVGDDSKSDVATQTKQILVKIAKLLAECGSDRSKPLWPQRWVADIRNVAALNEIWDAGIDPASPPVRAGLCSAPAAPDWTVEIMVMAVRFREQSGRCSGRRRYPPPAGSGHACPGPQSTTRM